MEQCKEEWKVIIELLEKVDINLLYRLARRMFYYLYSREGTKVEELLKCLQNSTDYDEERELYANIPNPKVDPQNLLKFSEFIFQNARQYLPSDEISKLLSLWMAQERTRFLSIITENPNATLQEVKEALDRFDKMTKTENPLSEDERVAIRVGLARRFLSNNLPFIRVSKQYITIQDFYNLSKFIAGSGKGTGKIGGKSAGMLLGYHILKKESEKKEILKSIKVPRSWFITSDSIMEFIHHNALEEITSLKYQETDGIKAGFPFLQQLFKNSYFPPEIIEQLGKILDEIGEKPIIVRSSSLLEDSFGAAFSGKYKSLFLANRGTKKQKLDALLDAISEIYASVFSPDPIIYRKERGLLDFNEEMAILIQEVVGRQIGNYYFPLFAGVAFGYNEFRWSPRIEKKDGMVRIVFGLGTRAVDRVGDDYPILISPGKPNLRVNVHPDDIIRYSQKKMDLINLEKGTLETVEAAEVIKKFGNQIPNISNVLSIFDGTSLKIPYGALFDPQNSECFITFQGLFEKTNFLKLIYEILKTLECVLGYPPDVEFACDGEDIYFLQCRPQAMGTREEIVSLPSNVEKERVLFYTDRFVTSGLLKGIEWIVYVDPKEYSEIQDINHIKEIVSLISYLNDSLPRRKFLLIGPGRWGSRGDIKLGVPVKYSDINNTAMLVELSFNKGEYSPELSFGTHFFQDLIEADIRYLPIFQEGESKFNDKLFSKGDNKLEKIMEKYAFLKDVIKIYHTKEILPNSTLSVYMDGREDKAIALLE
ncbi:MAG: PEP/pyruvate-binding domain-containing protein [Thermoanaerobaculia bacterium]